jgi:hypothetical protein
LCLNVLGEIMIIKQIVRVVETHGHRLEMTAVEIVME